MKLNIYGIQGALINRLVDERQAQGQYSVLWKATDESGTQVPGGIYLFRINITEKSNSFSQMNKMVLVK